MTASYLLSRDEFRQRVFERDGYRCVICKALDKGLDSHHIIERRLFEDGGYYLGNGASLCHEHHWEAEQTLLSCTQIREAATIAVAVLPPELCPDSSYDKWGNVILPDGRRMRGPLFHDASVQSALKLVLGLFTTYVKYPRTYHLPWSPGATSDDRMLSSTEHFQGQEVVVTVKEDGEGTTLYNDYMHARSIDGRAHPSRHWLKARHAQIAHSIPSGWRVCGENLFAKHSIYYTNLPDYFLVFSVWNDQNVCLGWDATKEWAELLGLQTVPELYRGPWNQAATSWAWMATSALEEQEGYVVRLAGSFPYAKFRSSVAKYVRSGHVPDENEHWMRGRFVPNRLARNTDA